MKNIHTDKAPAAVGPYSQAIMTEGLLFLSGQLGIDPATGKMVEGVAGQAEQMLKNAQAILEEAGVGFEKVIKTTVFLTDMADFQKVNEIYAKYFSKPFPARSAIAVAALPVGGLVEIEMIVEIPA
ncbi:RidA family protein [Allofustis seminis]|uniref:RidA family protein n=1 Tax=Allofustis seminis TaxID=166939 RepID=UPI00037B2BE1|nr:RidA family protein [Allofustis seminis]